VAARRRARRTQEERTASMRQRLVDATVDCLLRLGWAGTTTVEIAKRARVSRGAQLHHFPTKAELVTTAVQHLFDRRVTEFRIAFATLPKGANRSETAIDLLWRFFTGPTYYAVLELMVAARTDAALRRNVSEVHRRFVDTIRANFREFFPPPEEPMPFFDAVPHVVFAFMEGMALQRIVDPDDASREQSFALLKSLSILIERPYAPGKEAS
jgi:AcrR family transcriptional regulator